MALTLTETQTISELADFLYPFLPGKPHPFADQSISFAGIAIDLGLEGFWTGGSRRPAISALLEGTLSQAGNKFCPLMVQIVTCGLKYRSKSNPITKEEIENLNELIKKLGFKMPELWDSEFLRGLPSIKPEKDKVATAKMKTLKNTLPLLLNDLLNLTFGFSQEGLVAFSKGRPTNLIAVTGQDLYFILDLGMPLHKMIRLKIRLAVEERRAYVPVQELLFISDV